MLLLSKTVETLYFVKNSPSILNDISLSSGLSVNKCSIVSYKVTQRRVCKLNFKKLFVETTLCNIWYCIHWSLDARVTLNGSSQNTSPVIFVYIFFFYLLYYRRTFLFLFSLYIVHVLTASFICVKLFLVSLVYMAESFF